MIVMWFSRWREFRADAGGAQLAGRAKMVNALRALQRGHDHADLPGELAAFGISGGMASGFSKLFLSHSMLFAKFLKHDTYFKRFKTFFKFFSLRCSPFTILCIQMVCKGY